ncbi:DUF4139 domain-containing protein [Novosphingobium cyanobacteriorum]|nr:hypothetical protein [Novosphingobium cyanobacteriorum]
MVAGLALATDAWAQEATVLSARPDAVAITIYRAPDRDADAAIDLDWLGGYALVTETRTVDIPAGRATIRFEGVAGGILPESALLSGLPTGVREKNLDGELLSARNLYARDFGRPVILRRYSGHDGKGTVTEERAVIRSGADGAAILQTKAGFEVADCGRGFIDEIVYPELPPGLSAKPTLSVQTESPAAQRATVRLSYLAWGFDWQTNYLVRYDPAQGTADLLAWVTLASSDPTSFVDATTAVVGGEVNREDEKPEPPSEKGDLILQCYLKSLHTSPPPMVVALPPIPVPMAMEAPAMEIVVTAQRRNASVMELATKVTEEGLGDLKLYRVPVPTTVASNAQKQVAMHDLKGVKLKVLHTATLGGYEMEAQSAQLKLRTRNSKDNGLGVALPGGPLAVFEPHDGNVLLVGRGGLGNYAVNEDVEAALGSSPNVTLSVQETGSGKGWTALDAVVRNANSWPVTFEGMLALNDGERIENPSKRLGRRFGRPVWTVSVPAGGEVRLRYRVRSAD